MMKKIVAAALVLVSLNGAALGADLVAGQSQFDWSGGFVGLDAARAWGTSHTDIGGTAVTDPDPNGWLGGAYTGFNYQMPNALVLGVEGDIAGSSINHRSDVTILGLGGPLPFPDYYSQVDVNWTGALRARVGYAFDRFLPYLAGGVALADVDTTFHNSVSTAKFSDTYVGYTVGAGVEYAVTDRIIGRIEYRYTDFGSKTNTDTAGPTRYETDLSTNELRLGVSFKF